jgi:hypothetical protein
VTSIKSLDLGAATYRSTSALTSRVNGMVDEVAGYAGGRLGSAQIFPGRIGLRRVVLAIEPGAMTLDQQAVLAAAVQRANGLGVALEVMAVP